MSVWKSDETLLSICILNFSFKNDFVWEEISNIRHSVSSPDETPRSSSKMLRCASYFQLSSRCFIWWWNTASHVWYITFQTVKRMLAGWLIGHKKKCFVLLCPIGEQHLQSSFREFVHECLSRHSCPVRSQSFPNLKRRNYRWVVNRFGRYQQEQEP